MAGDRQRYLRPQLKGTRMKYDLILFALHMLMGGAFGCYLYVFAQHLS